MPTGVYVVLDAEQRRALEEMARRHVRNVRQQIAYIIRCELDRQGLLGVTEEEGDELV